MTFKHFVLIGAVGLLGLVVILVMSNVSKSKGGGTAQRIDANELMRAYKTNEEKADAEFKNKALEVTGTVTENTQGMVLELDSGVMAESSESAEKAFEAIKQGDRVTVRGLCTGFRDMQFVHLRDCELVKSRSFEHP